jgi:hypothetical protein
MAKLLKQVFFLNERDAESFAVDMRALGAENVVTAYGLNGDGTKGVFVIFLA